ncbi:uncharacterized protein PV09_02473 [Verruconis gallopava]|uniref:DDHD domain-containing protein n=1 Tax=Verruconis gallopava TaxID=253628 RepID=A0A0D2AIR5_9PEZI|nr:uncharacterized protein PV09_02473 [Verruconis gallopava]KIW06793.1 hypothetical protein PV09_02473 [Verruconis gallopava]
MTTREPAFAGSTRRALERVDRPPPIAVRYFYTSPLAIDDPLSPLPPPSASATASYKVAPRPFSQFDNAALDKAWKDIRQKRLKLDEKCNSEKRLSKDLDVRAQDVGRGSATNSSTAETKRRSIVGSVGSCAAPPSPKNRPQRMPSTDLLSAQARSRAGTLDQRPSDGSRPSSLRNQESSGFGAAIDTSTVTGNPFIRAPSKKDVGSSSRSRSTSVRPLSQKMDSYDWSDGVDIAANGSSRDQSTRRSDTVQNRSTGPTAKVPVGVSRLHEVIIPDLKMEPIYWSPVNDVASVVRGTWFYADNMLPVEVDVANMLEAGYVQLRAWSQTWKDELDSAVEVGALGEMKILHKLWPEKPKVPTSRPSTSRTPDTGQALGAIDAQDHDPEKEREEIAASAGDLIDIAVGSDELDHKAAGSAPYGRDGTTRKYLSAGVIYANEKEAYILRQSLQPSDYYGRRPLANYIRKGHKIGLRVVRGFDQQAWDKLHPPKKHTAGTKAREGVSSAASGIDPEQRQQQDATLSESLRPHVTDLVLVIHGIGQKLSERMESYHFTHAMNTFRRDVNVELGSDAVKAHLRPGMGGIMVLPVNWRLTLSFEEGGYRPDDFEEDPALNVFTLKDITPETLPSVRNIVSDVMLDIPYYLSAQHSKTMLEAVIREANRIYRLWCANNPGFSEWGRVHLIAHSLGSVMALDVLSNQPTRVSSDLSHIPVGQPDALPTDHFLFNTRSLFTCGSPSGFFLLLRKGSLLPRRDSDKSDASSTPGVAGEQGTYGCLAVDNIYNVVNPYDPVAYCLNAAVDVDYAASLKQAWVPSSQAGWLSVFSRASSNQARAADAKPALIARLPSNVELETHNFTREEIAEKRAYLLNDNGQIDYFLRYGGGPLEIQYLTMLGAHSSYWTSRDFIRMIVVEVGRVQSKEGTLVSMRAQKKKKVG